MTVYWTSSDNELRSLYCFGCVIGLQCKLSDKLNELGLDLGLGIGFGWYLCSIMVADH